MAIPKTYNGASYDAAGITLSTSYNPVTITGDLMTAAGIAVYGNSSYVWTVTNNGTVESTAGSGTGIKLKNGGTVINGSSVATSALISGNFAAVSIYGQAGTVINDGTILSPRGFEGYGVYLVAGGSVINGTAGALISGDFKGIDVKGAAGTVTNNGTVESTGTFGTGIKLEMGGTVTNVAPAGTPALIFGNFAGVAIYGQAGTVFNYGTILAPRLFSGYGVYLADGGSVTDGGNGQAALISGDLRGIAGKGAFVTVTNFGTVAATGTSGTVGVDLNNGGSVTNGSPTETSALISGGFHGVEIDNQLGTVINDGTISAPGNSGYGVILSQGGSVANGELAAQQALISAYRIGIDIAGAAGTVTNFGTVAATSLTGIGVRLVAGGSVNSGAAQAPAALISGPHYGIKIDASAGTVANLGTVAAADGTGVYLTLGGSIRNGAATARGAVISGYHNGIHIVSAAGTVTNFGTVAATGYGGIGIALNNGGSISNGTPVVSKALISGYGGVSIEGGTGTVTNDGTIQSISTSGTAIYFNDGGSVINGTAGALISGYSGIVIFGAVGSAVTNLGTIEGTGLGNSLGVKLGGGSVTNGGPGATTALVSGYSVGLEIVDAAGSATNSGTIAGTGTSGVGVYFNGPAGATLTNAGVIAGGRDAVLFKGAADVLIVEPGAVFDGTVDGGGSSAVTFTQAGVVGFGNFEGFATVNLASGASNTLSLTNANFTGVAGALIVVNGGNNGNTIDASALSSPNRLAIAGGAGTDVLTGGAGNDFFSLSRATLAGATVKGNGGSDVLALTTAGALSLAGVSGIEMLELKSGAANTLSLTNANFTGVTGGRITVLGGNNGNTIDASALSSPNSVTINGGAGTDVLTGGSGNDVFNLSAATLAGATVNGNGGSDTLALTTAGALSLAGVSGVETITLKSGAANTLSLANANFTGVTGAVIVVNGGNNGNTIDASALSSPNRVAIAGGAGTDVLTGGGGNDFFSLSAATLAGATVHGNGGSDVLAVTTTGALSPSGVNGVETFELKSGGANTLSLADANFTGVTGAKITVMGGNNGNTLSESGVAASNLAVLLGGSIVDTLIAGPHATLTGGAGVDAFEFVTPGTLATPDSNTITDFVHGTDKIAFSDIGFALGLGGATSTPQALPANLFSTKTDGTYDNTTERFAYNASAGKLMYSDDGSGGDPNLLVATLTGHPALTAGDLYFIT